MEQGLQALRLLREDGHLVVEVLPAGAEQGRQVERERGPELGFSYAEKRSHSAQVDTRDPLRVVLDLLPRGT